VTLKTECSNKTYTRPRLRIGSLPLSVLAVATESGDARDIVEEQPLQSFPASDAPSWARAQQAWST
jgi:hypothetical protein